MILLIVCVVWMLIGVGVMMSFDFDLEMHGIEIGEFLHCALVWPIILWAMWDESRNRKKSEMEKNPLDY